MSKGYTTINPSPKTEVVRLLFDTIRPSTMSKPIIYSKLYKAFWHNKWDKNYKRNTTAWLDTRNNYLSKYDRQSMTITSLQPPDLI